MEPKAAFHNVATMTLLLLTAVEILNLIAGAEERQQPARARYTWQETQENWRFDPYGRRIESSHRTKTFECILVNGQRYRKLVARNGQPLTPDEKFQVEEDMKRATAQPATSLRNLANTHQIEFRDGMLVAQSTGKRLELSFDPATYLLLRQTSQASGARTTIDFQRLPDGTHVPQRIEVDFKVEDIHGLQISTFANFTAN